MAVEVEAARRRFTREEYHRMAEVGILTRRDRVELIRGEIITMSPQGRRHRAFIDNLTQLLITRLGGRAIVSIQMPIVLADDTEPEPDVQVLRRRAVPDKDREADARPTPTATVT
jgi:Uma2 family endonuclease